MSRGGGGKVYRLNVVSVELPPLRERTSDIPLLVGHFAAKTATPPVSKGGSPVEFTAGALKAMEEYSWPGNGSELENFCERVILMQWGEKAGEKTARRLGIPRHVLLYRLKKFGISPPRDRRR
jgi:DNA-binding NtrC family response regulator